MEDHPKPTLVQYRRTSSDMDFSTTDSDNDDKDLPMAPVENIVKTESDVKDVSISSNSPKGEIDNFSATDYIRNDHRTRDKNVPSSQYDDSDRRRRDHSEDSSSEHRDKKRDFRGGDRSSSPDNRKRHGNNKRGHRSRDRSPKYRRRDDEDTKKSHHDRSESSERRKSRQSDHDRSERSRRSPDHHRHRSRSSDRQKYSPDRRKRSRRTSRSPDIFMSKRLERKVARIDKLGLSLVAEAKDGMGTMANFASQAKEVEARTGVSFPNYYNPGVMNPSRYAQQIQKRRLLWGAKKEPQPPVDQAPEQPAPSGSVKTWESTTFKGDNDGKMTEKFKRLMGIKGDTAIPASLPPSTGNTIIQKQEEMFSNMEAQYQVARMATHTHRGLGLGFGTFQVPPR